MKTTTFVLAVLALALTASPAPAGTPKEVEDLRVELETLTGAISAQLRLVGIYEEMGKTEEAAETRRQVVTLLRRQRDVLDSLARAMGADAEPPPPDRPAAAGPGPRPDAGEAPPAGPREPLEAPGSTAEAVRRGLAWLAAAQGPAGFWDADANGGYALYDPGVTGLALLAFLEHGETHREGRHRAVVEAGLRYLKQIQDPEGCFGPRQSNHFTYNHAIATLAMCRAFASTSSPLFRQSAQLGLDFVTKCQNPYLAWRYGVRPGDNDTSVTGWMVAALRAGKDAGLRVDPATFEGAKAWVEKVTEPEYGRVGYTSRGTGPARPAARVDAFPADLSESLTAEGIVIRVDAGEDPATSEPIRKGVDLILARPPVWNERTGSIDMYYWYWGSRALGAAGGERAGKWREEMRRVLLSSQTTAGDAAGSWPPRGVWGPDGGRVYSTALMLLVAAHGR